VKIAVNISGNYTSIFRLKTKFNIENRNKVTVTLRPIIIAREDDARINKGSFPPKDGPLNHEVYCFELGSPGILSATP